jgi:hypothetical protein
MVDVTFPFIILFGGLLAGMVTARVRSHRGARKAVDILVAAICGPLATLTWMKIVPQLLEQAQNQPPISSERASALADLLWFSPVIGGFIGVATVALGYRLAGHGPVRPHESLGEKIGDGLRIVGWVYAIIALMLAVGVVILAFSFDATNFITPVLLIDIFMGAALVLIGWVLTRLFRTPDTQSAVPPPT